MKYAKLIFWTAFNSYQSSKLTRGRPADAVHPVRTAAWTAARADLFVRYNLPSILAQSYTDFLYLVLLDPNLRQLTDLYLPKIDDPRILYVYEDEPVLSMIKTYDEIVLALIDNDDMYSRAAGQLMMNCPDEWTYFRRGFAMDTRRVRKLYHYDTIGSGPFFAHRFDPKKYGRFDRDKRHPTHKAVIGFKPTELPAGHFCVNLHNANTSSSPNMRYVLRPVGKEIVHFRRRFGFLGDSI